MTIKIKTDYVLELTNSRKFPRINEKIRLYKQNGPTCRLYACINNYAMNLGQRFTKTQIKKFLRHCRSIGINTKSGGPTIIGSSGFTERINDIRVAGVKCRAYWLDISNTRSLAKMLYMMTRGYKFVYSRSSGKDFDRDKLDLVLDRHNYGPTKERHAVNIGFDTERRKFIEYGSYGSNKYNILDIEPEALFALFKNGDIRPTVICITRYEDD